jgi:hypothetical protein
MIKTFYLMHEPRGAALRSIATLILDQIAVFLFTLFRIYLYDSVSRISVMTIDCKPHVFSIGY